MFFSPKTTVKITLQLYTVTYSGHKNKTAFMTVLQATDRGLEPLLTESESAVLPLHQSAILLSVTKLCFLFHRQNRVFPVIGVTGFEPAASTSRT